MPKFKNKKSMPLKLLQRLRLKRKLNKKSKKLKQKRNSRRTSKKIKRFNLLFLRRLVKLFQPRVLNLKK
jgi:hypothetical protein